jgi:type VI secretion system protein ImpA
LRALLQSYWAEVYPRLDPEDDNDPVERMNILAGITKPLGTFGDSLKFIERLRQAPLADSSRMGHFSLSEITGVGLAPGKVAAPSAEVTAAFRDTAPEKLEAVAAATAEAHETLKEIDRLLTEYVGANRAPNFEELSAALKEIQTTLRPHLPKDSASALAADSTAESSGGSSGTPTIGSSAGAAGIASREDVIRTLEKICEYYKSSEPGSPVPLLLKRAQRMVHMDFLQLMQDLAPESIGQVSLATGRLPETGQPSE